MEPSAKRLGIFGGTFNPPHLGHLRVAQEAWYRYELDTVVFFPAAKNPLKAESPAEDITDAQRLELLQSALEPDSRFSVDATELRRGGNSYTVDTLMRLHDLHPEHELFLIVGADAALTLAKWKDIHLFGSLCMVVICNRPGSSDLSQGLPQELERLGLRWEFMPLPALDVSSSDLRKRIRSGKPIRYLVSDAVAEQIHRNQLYQEN